MIENQLYTAYAYIQVSSTRGIHNTGLFVLTMNGCSTPNIGLNCQTQVSTPVGLQSLASDLCDGREGRCDLGLVGRVGES